ncbi:MAG: WYL domain-containing protein [Clostridiales bacterium]|nr:WYL domain-containing protein [Clostridiales bacterium]
MPKSENQKQKILYIKQYLEENTDENHSVTTGDIIEMLSSHNITAERKSIYSDLEALIDMGMDINIVKGRNGGIKLLSRTFQITELKVLVDAVQSSRFITQRKSSQLINKLESLTSVYERDELRRSVFIANRIKNENESIYYNTDKIFNAINNDRKISFKYFDLGYNRRKMYHNGGVFTTVSPYGLQMDNEKYYLIAYDSISDLVKHYRVDKMDNVMIAKLPRDGKKKFRNFDVAEYSKKRVKMFTGTVESVSLKCSEEFIGQIMDKFGKECKFFPTDDGEFTTSVDVALSPTFYAWVFTFAGSIKITSPQEAVDGYIEQLEKAQKAEAQCIQD